MALVEKFVILELTTIRYQRIVVPLRWPEVREHDRPAEDITQPTKGNIMSTTSKKVTSPCRQNKPKSGTASKPVATSSTYLKRKRPKLGASPSAPSSNGSRGKASPKALQKRPSKPSSQKRASESRGAAVGTTQKEIELTNETWVWLEKVASLSGVTLDQALCVTLAGGLKRLNAGADDSPAGVKAITIKITDEQYEQLAAIAHDWPGGQGIGELFTICAHKWGKLGMCGYVGSSCL